jgi:glucosamine--fructose-6-phosphate aminotransferase (isomerizing)
MCGIVAYLGDKEAYPILINGLRDWNTAGTIAPGWRCMNGEDLTIHKCQGKVSDLESHVVGKV